MVGSSVSCNWFLNTNRVTRSQYVSILKKYTDDYYKFITLSSVRKSGYEFVPRNKDDKEYSNKARSPDADEKMAQAISRAKSKIFEIAMCNDFKYFFTGTISPDHEFRYDLEVFHKKLTIFIRNYNRLSGANVKYVLIPEKHQDGAIHIHGLLLGIRSQDLVINEYGYLDWVQYRRSFGFMSLSEIKDKEACCRYITKYVSKDFATAGVGQHLYYCSRGLKRSVEVVRDNFDTQDVVYDYDHENFCKVKNLTGDQVYDFLRDLPVCR